MHKRLVIRMLIVATLAILAAQLVVLPEWRAMLRVDYWSSLSQFGKIMRMVHARYVHADEVSFEAFTERSLKAAVGELDKYSEFMTREDFERFDMASKQHYVGIGVEVREFGGRIIVTTVFEGGPAFKSGLEPGDFIVAVEGQEIVDTGLRQVVDRIRGAPGTSLALGIERPSTDSRLEFEIRRAEIALDTVVDVEMATPATAYLRIRQFTAQSDEELESAVEGLLARGMQALVIDLRGNPGGQLDSAVRMAGLFLEPGQVVVTIEGRGTQAQHVLRADSRSRRFAGPIAVLIDGSSASASEILSGALRDHQRAVLIGESSFGKGSVQSVYSFSNGRGLKLTTARYLLPGGEAINGTGVAPDIHVPRSDQQVIASFLQEHHLNEFGSERFERVFGYAPAEDKVRQIAVQLMEASW